MAMSVHAAKCGVFALKKGYVETLLSISVLQLYKPTLLFSSISNAMCVFQSLLIRKPLLILSKACLMP